MVDEFDKQRLNNFIVKLKDFIVAYSEERNGKESLNVTLTDILYGLSVMLATNLVIINGNRGKKDLEEGVEVVSKAIKSNALRISDIPDKTGAGLVLGIPKGIQDLIDNNIDGFEGMFKRKIGGLNVEEAQEDIGSPPQSIRNLSVFLASEVHKTLKNEGFDVGDYSVCMIKFSRGMTDNELKDVTAYIKFCRGKKPDVPDFKGGDNK